MRRKTNLLNKRCGYLLVISEAENDGELVRWLCKCICGKEVLRYANDLKRNRTMSCGCKHGNRKHSPVLSSAAAIFQSNYSDGDLTLEQFFEISQKKCYYCGSDPSNSHKSRSGSNFIYNGLDRINSSLPHLYDNCVPSCKLCNVMKWNLTTDNFINHIKRILDNMLK